MAIAPNAILIVLTWVKTFGIHKVLSNLGMPTSLATLLLRDGTAYFVYEPQTHFYSETWPLTLASAFCY